VRVLQVVAPTSGAVSFTVVDEAFTPVEPAEAYLAHLVAIERSPNTVRAYASSLKLSSSTSSPERSPLTPSTSMTLAASFRRCGPRPRV